MFGVNFRLRNDFFLSMISISTGISLVGPDTGTVRLGTPTANNFVWNTCGIPMEYVVFFTPFSVSGIFKIFYTLEYSMENCAYSIRFRYVEYSWFFTSIPYLQKTLNIPEWNTCGKYAVFFTIYVEFFFNSSAFIGYILRFITFLLAVMMLFNYTFHIYDTLFV